MRYVLFILVAFLCGVSPSWAESGKDTRLEDCLHRAEKTPDETFAMAESWLKQGGGDKARLCRAFAQFHRGEFKASGDEFAALAAARDTKDPKQAVSLHAQAGLAYMRLEDHKRAEAEYAAALRLEPQDPDIWMDRATERASSEHFWDAIEDLNKALAIMPDMTEALRLRGQVWTKLGLISRARDDFMRAEDLESGKSVSIPPQ